MTPGELFGLPLPGGTSVSHVRVYDTIGPDGLAGGSPHLHTVCTEAYLVIQGKGMVQTLCGEGYAEMPLVAGTIAWFSPGTVHRLVNLDGRLELYVLMSNAGLPEAGDMILAFEPHVLADHDRYDAASKLPVGSDTTDGPADAAMRRRDLAVQGFGHWKAQIETSGGALGLEPLHAAAVNLVGGRALGWRAILDGDPTVDLEASRTQINALVGSVGAGDPVARLAASAIRTHSLHPDTRRMGCCGTLGTVVH